MAVVDHGLKQASDVSLSCQAVLVVTTGGKAFRAAAVFVLDHIIMIMITRARAQGGGGGGGLSHGISVVRRAAFAVAICQILFCQIKVRVRPAKRQDKVSPDNP